MSDDLDPMLLVEASRYSDWHIDIAVPERSVLFLEASAAGSQGSEAQLGEAMPCRVPANMKPIFDQLVLKLKEHQAAGDAPALRLSIFKMGFRGERIKPSRYALRRIRDKVDPMDKLALGKAASDVLLDPSFRSGGLVLIAGETGAGKSTTAASTVVSRLQAFGGYCLTVESPIEVEFEGFHGNGYVEQVDATATGFKYEVASAMRKFPAGTRSMFYFGEVLDENAAAELARLIGRGHLVITTIHAKDLISAIEMLVAFAERGGETYARQLIGGNLRAIIHQRLQQGKPVVSVLKANDAIKNIIASTTTPLSQLANEVDMAKRQQLATAMRQPAMRP